MYKYLILITLFITIWFSSAYPQGSSDSLRSIEFFIDGKTEDVKGNHLAALENYKTALKFYKSPGIYFAISQIYSEQGKMQEALIEINNALRMAPGDLDYLDHKARIYYTMDNLVKSSEIFEQILSADSGNTYALYSLARIYEELKQPSEAIVVYEKLTDIAGFDLEILRRMYDIYISFKDYENCLLVIKYALKLDPFNSQFLQQLGALYIKLNRDDEAKKVLEEIFALNPENKNVQSELVKLYFKGNQTDKGFESFATLLGKEALNYEEKVQLGELYFNTISQDAAASEVAKNIFIQLNNQYVSEWKPYYYLGELDIIAGNNNAAAEKFERAVQYADTGREVYIQVGFALYRIWKNQESFSILSKGIEMFPDDFRMNYFYGLALQRQGREADAVIYFEKALTISQDEVNLLSTLAMAYNGLKRYEESDNAYERALMLDPNNVLVLNNYAYNLSERGEKLDKALEMIKKVIEREPNSASYLDTYGWVLYKLKKYSEAKIYIEKAVSISGSSAVLLEHLGDVYLGLKDIKTALTYWKKASELNPNNMILKEKINFYKED